MGCGFILLKRERKYSKSAITGEQVHQWFVSLTHSLATCAKALLSTQRQATGVHQVSKELPSSWCLVQLNLRCFGYTVQSQAWPQCSSALTSGSHSVSLKNCDVIFTCPALCWWAYSWRSPSLPYVGSRECRRYLLR